MKHCTDALVFLRINMTGLNYIQSISISSFIHINRIMSDYQPISFPLYVFFILKERSRSMHIVHAIRSPLIESRYLPKQITHSVEIPNKYRQPCDRRSYNDPLAFLSPFNAYPPTCSSTSMISSRRHSARQNRAIERREYSTASV